MKRTFLTLALLIGASAASTTVANDGMAIVNVTSSELNVKAMKGLKFRVTASNLDQKSIVVIKDDMGQVLFTESCGKDTNYAKIFDLSYLADGTYKFEVKSGGEVMVKPFVIETKRTASLEK